MFFAPVTGLQTTLFLQYKTGVQFQVYDIFFQNVHNARLCVFKSILIKKLRRPVMCKFYLEVYIGHQELTPDFNALYGAVKDTESFHTFTIHKFRAKLSHV